MSRSIFSCKGLAMEQQQVEDGTTAGRDRDRDLANFILDLSDDSCPAARHLHLPAYNGDADALCKGLRTYGDQIDSKIRPFGATPLRLAATGASQFRECSCPTNHRNKACPIIPSELICFVTLPRCNLSELKCLELPIFVPTSF